MSADKGFPVEIIPALPSYGTNGVDDPVLRKLVGATIVRIGLPSPNLSVEGGGLAIGFMRPGSSREEVVIFAFNDLGLWVEAEI